ncbi:hypothetical protein BDZ97DRAFT_1916528 [Flammula alnicola]|nr:hypothetical protein BDZ97DRAFT_1916528 [Flammula alnicola]
MSNEDILPFSYKYAWSAESELPLQDFLAKLRPSMVENDGTKPWIWVRGSAPSKEDSGVDEATKEATKLLKEVTEKVEIIQNDPAIPTRSNKKIGAKNKKELREQVQAEATEQLKDIAIKHGYVSGKWLIFAPAEKVDLIWSSVAKSLVSGPLHSTPAYLAKVSTSSGDENAKAQHLICIYLPDVYDKASVAEVMKVLLRNHGANLSGVKSNLYTTIGIDSKHSSGIPSTTWKNTAVIPEKEAKELKDAFFAELASTKGAPPAETAPAAQAPTGPASGDKAESAPTLKKAKTKPKLKRKVDDDPFASDDGDDSKAKEPKGAIKTNMNDAGQAVAQKAGDAEDGGSGTKVKRAQKAEKDEDDEEEEERPKKKRAIRK